MFSIIVSFVVSNVFVSRPAVAKTNEEKQTPSRSKQQKNSGKQAENSSQPRLNTGVQIIQSEVKRVNKAEAMHGE